MCAGDKLCIMVSVVGGGGDVDCIFFAVAVSIVFESASARPKTKLSVNFCKFYFFKCF